MSGARSVSPTSIWKSMDRGLNDVYQSGRELQAGNVDKAFSNYAAGMLNVSTYGASEALGFKGQTLLTQEAMAEAAQNAGDLAGLTATEKLASRQKITEQLKAAADIKKTAPGRSATLLTSNLVPNSQVRQTLLTTAGRG